MGLAKANASAFITTWHLLKGWDGGTKTASAAVHVLGTNLLNRKFVAKSQTE